MTVDQAYQEAKKSGWSQKLEDIVVDSGHPYWAYRFAKNIKGANIPKLEQVVIDSGDSDWAYSFARDIKKANISDLIDFVLIDKPKWIKTLFDVCPDLKRKYINGK